MADFTVCARIIDTGKGSCVDKHGGMYEGDWVNGVRHVSLVSPLLDSSFTVVLLLRLNCVCEFTHILFGIMNLRLRLGTIVVRTHVE